MSSEHNFSTRPETTNSFSSEKKTALQVSRGKQLAAAGAIAATFF